MSEQTVIPYTAESFATGTAPYEYLWSLRDNPFKQSQEVGRLERTAKALGIGSQQFKTMWRNYQIINAPTRETLVLSNVTDFPDQEITLKCEAYICDMHGVYLDDPKQGMVPICAHPIMPTRRIVNLDTNECKTEISWYRDKRWRHQIFDGSVLGSAQKIVALKNVGIAVNSENARQLVSYLGRLEELNWDALPRVDSIGRLGWMADHGFSPYVNGVTFDGNEQYRHAFEAVQTVGSFEVWKDCVSQIRTGKSIAARIMLASSFASALVEPLNALPFIVHCWSNVSGIGKTVTLMAAGSVWANPRQGEYLKTYNATSVGIEMMAGFYGSMPLCMDELQLRSDRREQFDAMIYSYCEGVGRTRGAKNGGLQRTLTWHNCMISTGEEPITSGTSKAGAVNRVLDIAAGGDKMLDDPRGAVQILLDNHGHAGPMFVRSLTEDAVTEVKAIQESYTQQLEGKATDKQRLSASIILAADAWATKVIFQDGRALTVDDIAPYLQTDASTDVNQRAYDYLMDTVSANSARFASGENPGECWGTIDDGNVYIIKAIFDRIMQDEGYNSVGFLSWARHRGLLRTAGGKKERMTITKRLPRAQMPARCVCIRMPSDEQQDEATGYTISDECTSWENI